MSTALPISEKQVLLVEASSMQANIVSRMLASLGVSRIQISQTGSDALASMRQSRADMVISSLYLADMPGTDLVQAMRRDADLESVPFILISSETRPQVLDPVRQSGACCIVPKPFTQEQLAAGIRAANAYLETGVTLSIPEPEALRVLLVDDSQAARRHYRRLLEALGIEKIFEAENGREALAHLDATMVDVVLTDYNMPEMDGRALTEYIRTKSWQNSVPILMFTSEHDQGRLAAVERAGVSAICDKPLDAKTIGHIIAEAISA